MRRGAAYLGSKDFKNATLSARRALQIDPRNAGAARVLAQVGELSGDAATLEWRRKVVELEPQSTDDALALANAGLRFHDLSTAEKALQRLGDKAQQSAEYHAAAAALASARKNPEQAEAHWARAAELAPQDKSYQLQLASTWLESEREEKRASARRILTELRGDAKVRVAATRTLITDGAARRNDPQNLAEMARELQSYPEAIFSDRILYLEILRQLHDPKFKPYLIATEEEASQKPEEIFTLISWMSGNGLSDGALEYVKVLRCEIVAKWPVPLALSEAYSRINDWGALERHTQEANWEQFEFLRHAYLARSLRSQGKAVAAEREWSSAQKDASIDPRLLSMLVRTISDWGWQDQTLELLWELAKQPETQTEALQSLYKHYADSMDTAGLYRVLLRLGERQRDNLRIQNNLAQISLLENADVGRARKVAAELYQKEPSNPEFVSTYAFSLYTRGEVEKAIEAMSKLREEQLSEPAIAAYYGILLSAAGDKQKARAYLSRAAGAKLLPEEKALVARAENLVK